MTDKLNVNTIVPAGSTLTVGTSGGSVAMTDDVKVNTVKDTGGSYKIDAFTSTGASTWTCPTGVTSAEILIVAGGGGGSAPYYAGGGGAGGVVHATAFPVTGAVVYDLTVGAGGTSGNATAGGNSVFNVNGEGSNTTVLTANGGGRGGGGGGSAAGGAGGSGGGTDNDTSTGGASNQTASFGSPQIATGYGNAGGGVGGNAGGGGGGANAVGAGTNGSYGGAGGAGKLFSNFVAYGTDSSNVASTGSNGGYFGGGAGGGSYNNTVAGGAGGVGGGGTGGGTDSPSNQGTEGQSNTGGGGGGGDTNGGGKAGGSGIILIRYIADPTTLWVSDGSGNLSSVNSAFGGATKLLSTSADVGSGVTSIAFTSGISSTYDEYIFKFDNIRASADYASIYFQCSIDGGSNYNIAMTSATFWSWNYTGMDNQGLAVYGAGQGNGTNFQEIATNIGSDGTKGTLIGELHLFDPGSTSFVKQWWSRTSNWRADDRVVDFYAGGYFNTTSAINAIKFQFNGNVGIKEFEDESRIKMYGVA